MKKRDIRKDIDNHEVASNNNATEGKFNSNKEIKIERGVYNKYDVATAFDEKYLETVKDMVSNTKLDEFNVSVFDNPIRTNLQVKRATAKNQHIRHLRDYEERENLEKASVKVLRDRKERLNDELEDLREKKREFDEKYASRNEGLEHLKKLRIPFFASLIVIYVLSVIFIATDSISIYDILSQALLQSRYLSIALCVAVVALLDFSPLPLSHGIIKITSKDLFKKKQGILLTITILLSIVLLYSGVIALRVKYVDKYVDTSGTNELVNTAEIVMEEVSETQQYSEKDLAKAKAMVWLLMVEPIASTIVLLVISLIHDFIEKENEEIQIKMDMKYDLEKEGLEIRDKIKNIEEQIDRINYDIIASEDHVDYESLDNELYANELEMIAKTAAFQKSLYLLELAKALNEPDAISKVSEPFVLQFAGGAV